MFIKYDEYELLELFLSEPISIADDEAAGEYIYSYTHEENFKLILSMSVYGQTCSLDITYKDVVIFTGDFDNVTSLQKTGDYLVIHVNDEAKVKVKFMKYVGVELL